MKKAILLLAIAIPVIVFFSCQRRDTPGPGGSGTAYLDLPDSTHDYFEQHVNGPIEGSSPNDMATLGRVLFYERQLSINNSISCGSCHKQALAFSDNVAKSRGFENRLTGRNTPPIQNLGFSGLLGAIKQMGFGGGGRLFWDGRENDLSKLIMRPISNHVEMGIEDLSTLVAKLNALPYYPALFRKAYGEDGITVEKISRAVSAFLECIVTQNTRFDQYQQRIGTLSALELEGEQLFTNKYNCGKCHNENLGGYNSGEFMNIGLDAPYTDKGVGVISNDPRDNGKFKVPNLRNVALTAPYMHDGRFKTLDDVLEHYSHGIKADVNLDTVLKTTAGQPMRMNISTHERQAIIAFLGTLTDVDMITNPAFSDPFKIK